MGRFFRTFLVLVIGLATVIGCGSGDPNAPRLYRVSGIVTYSGEPLEEGDLVMRTTNGKYAAGARIMDGKFTIKAAAGSSIVEITALRDVPEAEYRQENPGERVPVREQFLPAKYNSESTLKVDVEPNTKDVKFDLTP